MLVYSESEGILVLVLTNAIKSVSYPLSRLSSGIVGPPIKRLHSAEAEPE